MKVHSCCMNRQLFDASKGILHCINSVNACHHYPTSVVSTWCRRVSNGNPQSLLPLSQKTFQRVMEDLKALTFLNSAWRGKSPLFGKLSAAGNSCSSISVSACSCHMRKRQISSSPHLPVRLLIMPFLCQSISCLANSGGSRGRSCKQLAKLELYVIFANV